MTKDDFYPLKDQTLTIVDFGDYWQKPEPTGARHEGGKWLAWFSPSDYGMPLAECSWVDGVGHLEMKCIKSFDPW